MAVTHFKITQLPYTLAINSLFDGQPLIENQLYPISDENLVSFNRTGSFLPLSLNVPFFWKAVDNVNNVESPETESILKFWDRDLETEDPTGSDETIIIFNDEEFNLLDLSDFNDTFTFIEINSVNGIDMWLYKNQPLYKGLQIPTHEFDQLKFKALSSGGNAIYSQLQYFVGNDKLLDKTKPLNITVQLDTLGALNEISNTTENVDNSSETPIVNDEIFQNYLFEIINGYVNSHAKIRFTYTCPFFNESVNNESIIRIGQHEQTITSDGVYEFDVNVNNLGKIKGSIDNYIEENNANPKTGTIEIELLEINNDVNLVDNLNNLLTLNINY